MKFLLPLVALSLMVAFKASLGEELVRGGNLDLIQGQLLHMEGHHEDLEKFEDKLDVLITKEQHVLDSEDAMEIGIDKSVYANDFNHPNAKDTDESDESDK